jgi:NAD(P)-dependent dehydrogenase (short-subunit alcohol dehydrogenase family)
MGAFAPGKVVLLTGATDGLGKATAILLAERGYRVFGAGRSAEKRAALQDLAHSRNLPLETLEMDVCDDESVRHGVELVRNRAGEIDVLINNAGFAFYLAFEELSLDDWRRQFETNVFGVVRVTQAVLPCMRERRQGRIVMMSSVSGFVTGPMQSAYSATKHAVEGLSNALRHELHPFGVQTILIEPGYIVSGIQQVAADLAQPYMEKVQNGPYARLYASAWKWANSTRARSKTTPEDCARVILRAIEATHPKPRYGVTKLATLAKWGKRLLADSMADHLIRGRYGIPDRL